jgi:hypothetical protein
MGTERPIKPGPWLWLRTSHASHLRVAAALMLAALLPACSASQFAQMPSVMGGETADTPRAPANPPAYPAVHDMPATRPVPLMTEQEQKAAEAELIAARDRQNPGSKKKAAPAQGDQQAASRQPRPAKPAAEQSPSNAPAR